MMELTRTRLPETKEVHIYNSQQEAKVSRLAEVTFSNETVAYVGWHDLVVLRQQFCRQFKRDMPGVTDKYRGKVRAFFSWETFFHESSGDEEKWVDKRLPDRKSLQAPLAPRAPRLWLLH